MTFEVGKNIDGWCTRCKLVLTHTIEAVASGKITRVHCNTCRGRHVYRAKAPGARAQQGNQANKYASLLRGRTESASRPYSTSSRYVVGELISHHTLGLGVVMAERESVKIDILFADGPKVLLQGRTVSKGALAAAR